MKKGALENFVKLNGEHLWFAKFSRIPFLQSTSATATLLRWGTANSVWKTSDEYPLSRNTNLRSTVQTYHFFFGSINFQCMFSLVYTVYCQEQPPEQKVFCKKKVFLKFHKKALLLEPFFNKVAGLTPILKNICQRLLLHYTHTTHCYLSVLLYIQHLLPHHHCYYSEVVVRMCSIRKGVLRNFEKFTGKHLYQSLLFDKIAGLRLQLY